MSPQHPDPPLRAILDTPHDSRMAYWRTILLVSVVGVLSAGGASGAPPESIPAPETLDDAWASTLAIDGQVDAARYQVQSARQSLRAAESQNLPDIRSRASYTFRNNEPTFIVDVPTAIGSSFQFPYAQDRNGAAAAVLSYPVYTGGRIANEVGAAAAGVGVASNQFRRTVLDRKLEVALAFIAVHRSRSELTVAEANVRRLEAHRVQVARFFAQNMSRRTDLLAAEVALAHAQQTLLQVRTAVDSAQSHYNRLLGRPLTDPVHIAPLSLQAPTESLDALTAMALTDRPELSHLAQVARSYARQADSRRAARLPQVELRGAFAYEENRYQAYQGIGSAAVLAEWSLYDGGRLRDSANALDHQSRAAGRLRDDLQSAIALEVRQAWLALDETRKRIEVAEKALVQAEENVRLSRSRYENGLATNTDVLDADAMLNQTTRDHLHSFYDWQAAILRLRRANASL